MAGTKHIILIFALILFSTQAAISEESHISNTQEARCVLQITMDTNMKMDYNTLESLIHTSGVTGKAAREILGASSDKVEVTIGTQKPRRLAADPYTFNISARLDGDVKPAANEFLKALIENLRQSLIYAHGSQLGIINEQYEVAMKNFKKAEVNFNNLKEEPVIRIYPTGESNIDSEIKKQLEKRIDLSNLDPGMSFDEVLNEIANSVNPPLQIQPNWGDLADLPAIQPTTLADMRPLKNVKVSTALETLLSNLSTPDMPLGYTIQDKIILIATKENLPINLVATIYDISGLLINGRTTNILIKAIKETIEPESWYNENNPTFTSVRGAGYKSSAFPTIQTKYGEGKIIDMEGGKISIYNTPEIQSHITDFLTYFPKDIQSEPIESISANILFEEQQELSSKKRMLELDIARLEARRETAEQQIISLSSKMKTEESIDLLIKKRTALSEKLSKMKMNLTENHPEVVEARKEIDEINVKIAAREKDTITAELEQLVENLSQQLARMKTEVELGIRSTSELTSAEEKLVQAKIQLARRREELARPVGVEQLSTLNENLSMTILDLAENKAEYQVIERQLAEINNQIKAATTTDPKVVKYREAEKALKEAEKNLNRLKDLKDNMQYPEVVAIGLE